MTHRLLISVLICLIFTNWVIAQDYINDPEKGWNWYKDPALEKPKEVNKPESPTPEAEEKPSEEVKEEAPVEEPAYNTSVDNFKFPLTEEAKSVPVLAEWLRNPTEENATKWLAWQAKYFKHNEQIARSLRNAYLNHGDKVYRLEGMSEQPLAMTIASRKKKATYQEVFSKAAQDVAIFFFYKNDCEYCEAQVSPLSLFANQYNFIIKGIVYSPQDAKEGLPFSTRVVPELFHKYEITSVPTIAAYNNKSKNIQVIAKGYTPTSQIELNLKAFLLKEKIINEEDFLHLWRTEDTQVLEAMVKDSQGAQGVLDED